MRLIRLIGFTSAVGCLLLAGCVSPDHSTAGEAQFVGSEKCAGCHQQAFNTWKQSYHARMVLPREEGLLKDAGDQWSSDGKNQGPAKGNVDGKPYSMKDVVYVIGTRWKQRYLVPNAETGNHQFLDKQWNRFTKQWEPYGQRNDWETQCATCHTTGYRVVAYDEKTQRVLKAAMTERNIGCEACHGPGSAHVASPNKATIFNPKNASAQESSKICGQCHIRIENYKFKTAQGNPAEHMPHPQVGQSFRAGKDDWTTWYPKELLAVNIHAEDAITGEYKGTDLFNAFWQDEQSKKTKLFDARKHHQEYQEFVQSKHSASLSCSTCHTPHAMASPRPAASESCQKCHGNQYDWQKVMPGTAQTALQLFVRTHTFNAQQARAGGMTADKLPAPEFYYRK